MQPVRTWLLLLYYTGTGSELQLDFETGCNTVQYVEFSHTDLLGLYNSHMSISRIHTLVLVLFHSLIHIYPRYEIRRIINKSLLAKEEKTKNPSIRKAPGASTLGNMYFDTFQHLTLLKWNQNFHIIPVTNQKNQPVIGQRTYIIHDSITWNHGNCVLGKEVTMFDLMLFHVIESEKQLYGGYGERYEILVDLRVLNRDLFQWPLCCKRQFSVLKKPINQLTQMGKMICSTDLVLAIHWRAVLTYPQNLSSTHLEIYLFRRAH